MRFIIFGVRLAGIILWRKLRPEEHGPGNRIWYDYRGLPRSLRGVADKNFELLKANPRHGSIRLKKVAADIYSARIGLDHRALAFDRGTHLLWFWVGSHDEYEHLIG